MKTKLNYEFEDNEDDARFYMICNAEGLYYALWNLDQWLRGAIKYPDDDKKKLNGKTLQEVRDMLHEFMEDHGCDFEHIS